MTSIFSTTTCVIFIPIDAEYPVHVIAIVSPTFAVNTTTAQQPPYAIILSDRISVFDFKTLIFDAFVLFDVFVDQ